MPDVIEQANVEAWKWRTMLEGGDFIGCLVRFPATLLETRRTQDGGEMLLRAGKKIVAAKVHERDLMRLQVAAPVGPAQTQVKELAEIFRGRIVDVAADSVIVEISGTEKKIEGFIELVRPLGILELVRTGRIAMVRGSPPTRELTEAADGARPADASPEHDSLA